MFDISWGSGLLGAGVALILAGAGIRWWPSNRWPRKSVVPAPHGDRELPEWFSWLADAPMFLDERLVSSFYDAVLRPGFLVTGIQLSEETTTTTSTKTSLGLKAADLMPGLSLGAEVATSESLKRGETRTLVPIHNAPRELVQLTLHYLDRYYPDPPAAPGSANDASRIWTQRSDEEWNAPSRPLIESRPRMLAFLDFPTGTRFVPMAVETDKGVVAVYEALIAKLRQQGDAPACPAYPDDPQSPDFAARSNEYWQWFYDHWNANTALVALEEATKDGGRIRWVNYRVPVRDGLTLHLNVVGYGEYDTGVFAYNLIKRGSRHGVRVVGTVRAEPGLNVMAIYDK